MAKIQVPEPKDRFVAAAIDFVPPFLLFLALVPVKTGLASLVAILGSVYLIFRDVLGNGQSIGKRFVNLQVVDTDTDRVPDTMALVLRNLGFGIPGLNVLYALVEGIQVLRQPQGLRFGDLFAQTGVVAVPADEREKLLVPKPERVSGSHRVVTGEGPAVGASVPGTPDATPSRSGAGAQAPSSTEAGSPPAAAPAARKAPVPIDLPPETEGASKPAAPATPSQPVVPAPSVPGVTLGDDDPLKKLVDQAAAVPPKR